MCWARENSGVANSGWLLGGWWWCLDPGNHKLFFGWIKFGMLVRDIKWRCQALGSGALGRPRGSGWRGRWEGESGWGPHVNPWPFHFNVWQNSLQKKKKRSRKKKWRCQYGIWIIKPGTSKRIWPGDITSVLLTIQMVCKYLRSRWDYWQLFRDYLRMRMK